MPDWPDMEFRLKRAVRDALGLLEEPDVVITVHEDSEYYTITVIAHKINAVRILRAGGDNEDVD